jgi:hypothetical protein
MRDSFTYGSGKIGAWQNSKFQAPRSEKARSAPALDFADWSFSGAWMLVLGDSAFQRPHL